MDYVEMFIKNSEEICLYTIVLIAIFGFISSLSSVFYEDFSRKIEQSRVNSFISFLLNSCSMIFIFITKILCIVLILSWIAFIINVLA